MFLGYRHILNFVGDDLDDVGAKDAIELRDRRCCSEINGTARKLSGAPTTIPQRGTAARCSRKETIDHARVRGDEGAVQGDGRAIKRSDETTSNDE